MSRTELRVDVNFKSKINRQHISSARQKKQTNCTLNELDYLEPAHHQ